MNYENLWEILELDDNKLEAIKKSYRIGVVPELPPFITGQNQVKTKIKEKLIEIDNGIYFNRVMITGEYGNGKTNLLKYLQLYFNNYKNLGIKYIIQRANADLPDIFLQLLKLLEEIYINELVKAVKNKVIDADKLEEIKEDSPNIKEYIDILFSREDNDEIKKLIYMGTGRFYTKNYFNKYSINKITDFDRREVLVLFLNLLSYNKCYVIFAIDEIEKILDKSKIRFKNFLTSYRELIDISSKIKGHLLLTAMTGAQAQARSLFQENPAFSSRIEKDITELKVISSKNDILELIDNIQKIFKTDKDRNKIYTEINTKIEAGIISSITNRTIVQEICQFLLTDTLVVSIDEKIEEFGLIEQFTDKYTYLDEDLEFDDLPRTFMYTLESYVKQIGYDSDNLKVRDEIFIKPEDNLAYFFFFNENNFEKKINSAKKYISSDYKIVIYSPEYLEIKHEMFTDEVNNLDDIMEIKYLEVEKTITLIKMYQDPDLFEYNKQIFEIIKTAFKGYL